MIERFADHGVQYLTLYAFSTENWNRPQREVRMLIRLLGRFIKRELENLHKNGIRLRHARAPGDAARLAAAAGAATAIELTARQHAA